METGQEKGWAQFPSILGQSETIDWETDESHQQSQAEFLTQAPSLCLSMAFEAAT